MLLKLLRFLIGYVEIEVYGFAPERFINLIIKNEIVIWDIKSTDKGYIFYTGRYNLMKMKPYLQKTNMKMKLLQKYGFPYFIKNHKNRVVFLAGFGVFLTGIYILSLFIWEVRIIGEDKLVQENVLEYIEDNYVPLGTLKTKIDCKDLEENLRAKYSDISWISCELKGTGLTVYLEEGMSTTKSNNNDESGDVIASKDAQITKMITREGTPIAKVKDNVKKGDVLISGTIYIYDDNNEVIETSYIPADGDVYGITTYQYEDYIDLKYYDKHYTEDSKKYITFYVGNYCITPYTPKRPKDNYDTYTDIHKAKIFDNFYLPLGYKMTEWNSYVLERKSHTTDEAKKLLEKRLNEKITSFKEKGVEIIENDVKIEQDGERLIAKGTLTLNESITSFKVGSQVILQNQNID
ncbi:MAG: sporulation protein YqfD [Lachnospiraceae bacterium]|nr:sporulation protein YqfD [Lachnospiraceae bacterium]